MARPRKYDLLDGRYKCPDCNKTFKSQQSSCNHWRKDHNSTKNNNNHVNSQNNNLVSLDEWHKELGIAYVKVRQLEMRIIEHYHAQT